MKHTFINEFLGSEISSITGGPVWFRANCRYDYQGRAVAFGQSGKASDYNSIRVTSSFLSVVPDMFINKM